MSPATAERIIFAPTLAANDNLPPDKEADPWRQLIDRWRTISEPLAIFAAQMRLQGWAFDDFAEWFLDTVRREGWAA